MMVEEARKYSQICPIFRIDAGWLRTHAVNKGLDYETYSVPSISVLRFDIIGVS